jgi:tetratricopeptide (TPR) repeat protein
VSVYHLARSKAYVGLRKDAEAIKDLSTVIDLEPDNVGARTERGRIEIYNDSTKAIADFTWVLEREPKNMEVLIMRGDAKRRAKDHKGAIEDYTASLKIKRTYKGYYNRALAKKALGDEKGAKLDKRRAQKARGL